MDDELLVEEDEAADEAKCAKCGLGGRHVLLDPVEVEMEVLAAMLLNDAVGAVILAVEPTLVPVLAPTQPAGVDGPGLAIPANRAAVGADEGMCKFRGFGGIFALLLYLLL